MNWLRRQLPDFCPACGCPTKRYWREESRKFDPVTGVGFSRMVERLRCANSDKDRDWEDHVYMDTGAKPRFIPVEPACATL